MIGTVREFELELASPVASAQGTIDRGAGVLFDVFDKPAGLGEASPFPPFTESYEDCHAVLKRTAEAYTDQGWSEAIGEVTQTVDGQLEFPAARHAVSLAYLDQQARLAHRPLFAHLGGEDAVTSVPTEATIGDYSTVETVDRAEAAVEEGYSALKIKVGDRPVQADGTRVRAVRTAVGPDVDVRLDANGAWSSEAAQEFIDRTSDLDIDFIEQPLGPDEFAGHRDLRGSGVDIALDESVSLHPLEDLLAAEAADVFVLKPMTLGGVDIAYGSGVDLLNKGYRVVLSTTIESVVARTAAVHAAAALGDVEPSGLATGDFIVEDLAPDPSTRTAGTIELSDSPGLGIDEFELEEADEDES